MLYGGVIKILILGLITTISAIPAIVFATAFSMGTGKTWIEFCEGSTDELPSETAIEFCKATLIAYQIGAVQQANELGKPPTLCSRTLPPELSEQFVSWIKGEPERLERDFLSLYPEFLKEIDECDI